jgi:chorismate synthase
MRYLTAGESHGPCVITIIDSIPAHLKVNEEDINYELRRRQVGYGRSERMQIEKDKVEILSGVREGKTTGNPITLLIKNKDFRKSLSPINVPRPGHADLAGVLKFNHKEARNILERASARETAARVATGAIAKILLKEFGIKIYSHVIQIGKIKMTNIKPSTTLLSKADNSCLRCIHPKTEELMKKEIDSAKEKGDSVGGVFEIICKGVPPGLGSHTQWDKKIDARLAYAIMSIPGVKGVEIGLGFRSADTPGREMHDEIFYKNGKFYRKTNNAGGIEGGITNGEDIIIKAVMKPIPTLKIPLKSIKLSDKSPALAHKERADVCAVPACSVIGEAMAAIELVSCMQEKFGGDSILEMKRNYENYKKILND